MSLERAIGSVLTTETGILSFADESTNRGYVYPSIEVSVPNKNEITGEPYYVKEDGEYKWKVWKTRVNASALLTLKAKGTTTGSSEKNCQVLKDTVDATLDKIINGTTVFNFIDPVTSIDQEVHLIRRNSSTGPSIDLTGEPLTHVASIGIEIKHNRYYRELIETVIEKVIVDHGVIHV